jgi:hypothetical protein
VDEGRVVVEGRLCQAMAYYLENRANSMSDGDGMVVWEKREKRGVDPVKGENQIETTEGGRGLKSIKNVC